MAKHTGKGSYFLKDGFEHPLIGHFTKETEYGYSEPNDVMYNLVQVKKRGIIFSRWVTIEQELVPSHAWISAGTLGSTDWVSPLIAKYKPFMAADRNDPELSGPGL